jgi:hypothetical protein
MKVLIICHQGGLVNAPFQQQSPELIRGLFQTIRVLSVAGRMQARMGRTVQEPAADKRALQKEIRKAKAGTYGIIGVNTMVAL